MADVDDALRLKTPAATKSLPLAARAFQRYFYTVFLNGEEGTNDKRIVFPNGAACHSRQNLKEYTSASSKRKRSRMHWPARLPGAPEAHATRSSMASPNNSRLVATTAPL